MGSDKKFSIKGTASTEGATVPLANLKKTIDATKKSTEEASKSSKKASDQFSEWGVTALKTAGLIGGLKTIDELSQRQLRNANVTNNLTISIDAARKATRGFASDMDLSRSAAMAASFGVAKTEMQFAEMAEIALKVSARLGTDMPTALADMTTAFSRGSTAILDNLGVSLTHEAAEAEFAKTIGKSAAALTDLEKKQAFQTIGLKRLKEATADVDVATGGAGANIQKWKVAAINATDATLGFIDSMVSMNDSMYEMEAVNVRATEALDANMRAVRDFASETGAAVSPTDNLRKAIAGLADEAARMAKDAGLTPGDSLKLPFELPTTKGFGTEVQMAIEDYGTMLRGAAEKVAGVEAKARLFIQKKRTGGGRDTRTEFEKALGLGRGAEARFDRFAADGTMSGRDLLGLEAPQTVDPFSPEETERRLTEARRQEQSIAQIQLEERMRSIEMQRESGVDPLTLISQEESARVAFLEGEISRSNDFIEQSSLRHEIEGEHHRARLERMRIEQEKQRKDAELRLAYFNTISEATIGVGAAALQAALMGEGGVKAAVHAFAKGKSIEMVILAASETARGLAALASPFTAALAPGHFHAAAQAGIAAALIGTVAGVTGEGSGGFDRRASGGFGNGTFAGAGGRSDFGGGGASNRSGATPGGPIVSNTIQAQAGSANSSGGTTVIHANFQALGFASKDEVIGALRAEMVRHERRHGKAV